MLANVTINSIRNNGASDTSHALIGDGSIQTGSCLNIKKAATPTDQSKQQSHFKEEQYCFTNGSGKGGQVPFY